MKIALISDLHGQEKTLEYAKQIIVRNRPEAIIISGDVTSRGDVEFLENLFGVFRKAKVDAYVVWGNSDDETVRQMISDSPYNINQSLKMIGGQEIYGLGESDEPQPVNTDAIAGAILVTHKPPILSSISRPLPKSPKYHICGHLHSTKSCIQYPATTLIQVPSLTLGEYGLFDLENDSVEFKKL